MFLKGPCAGKRIDCRGRGGLEAVLGADQLAVLYIYPSA